MGGTGQSRRKSRPAASTAARRYPDPGTPRRDHPRRGKQARNIAETAAARQLLACVFYALRDGQVQALDRQRHEAARPRAARDRPQVWPPPRLRGRACD